MAVPTVATFSAAAIIAAHTSLKNLIDGGSSNGKIRVRNSADVLLADVPLVDPCGTVNGTTGQLVFAISGPDTSADVSGTAAYVEFVDSDNVVYLSLPAIQGTAPVSGKVVFNTLAITETLPVTALSATVG